MERLKIVITGAYAAGKTTFINSISQIETVSTEAGVSVAEELELKDQTTVALDFGIIQVSDDLALYLFGTPGQERFDFMWDILAEGCIGYIVMVDSTRPAQLKEAAYVIDYFSRLVDVPFVVTANKQDDPTGLPPEYISRRLGLPAAVPVLPCVATDRDSVLAVLIRLVEIIQQQIGVD